MAKYLDEHKRHLVEFWREYGDQNGRRGTSNKGKEETLAALIQLGSVTLVRSPKARTPEKNRSQYDKYKKYLQGYNGFTKCFVCQSKPQVRHHIIWIKNGGRNHKKNVIGLCHACHAEIHPWLKVFNVKP